jgi:exonuclease V
MDTPWDEYDAYDLSEFSATDFVHIESNSTGAPTRHNNQATTPEDEQVVAVTDGDQTGAVGTGGSGGLPQVAVELESTTDELVVVKVAGGRSGSGDSIEIVDGASRSPFEEFRSRTLSVSDLVGPAWYIPPFFIVCDGLIVC